MFIFWFIKKFSKLIIKLMIISFIFSAIMGVLGQYGVITFSLSFPFIGFNSEGFDLLLKNIANDTTIFLQSVVDYVVDFIDNFSEKVDSFFK